MVLKHEYASLMFRTFPEFEKSTQWKENLEFWQGEDAGLSNPITVFGRFVAAEMLQGQASDAELKKVFDFIEMLLVEGEQVVQDVAATCFLENLQNYDSHGRLDARRFVPFLGTESKEYCKGWDEFTGVKTPGLWEEDDKMP